MKRLLIGLSVGLIAAAFGSTAALAHDEGQRPEGVRPEMEMRDEQGSPSGNRGLHLGQRPDGENRGNHPKLRRHQQKLMKHVIHARVSKVDTATNTIYLHDGERKIVMAAKSVMTVIEEDGARAGTLADLKEGDFIMAVIKKNRNTDDKHDMTGYVVIKMLPPPQVKPQAGQPGALQPASQPAPTPPAVTQPQQ